jgi:hypothetical protein
MDMNFHLPYPVHGANADACFRKIGAAVGVMNPSEIKVNGLSASGNRTSGIEKTVLP